MNLRIANLSEYSEQDATLIQQAANTLARQNPYTRSFSRMAYFLGARQVLIVAIDQEQNSVIGFCQGVHLRRKKYSSVYNFGVWEGARGQGVGRALLEAMMAASPERKIQLVVDVRNTDALAFYQRFGFKAVGQKKSKSNDQLTVLEWEAPPA